MEKMNQGYAYKFVQLDHLQKIYQKYVSLNVWSSGFMQMQFLAVAFQFAQLITLQTLLAGNVLQNAQQGSLVIKIIKNVRNHVNLATEIR